MNAVEISNILDEAKEAANVAGSKFFNDYLNGVDAFPCGFAWVELDSFEGKKLKGNTKVGRALKAAGIEQDYKRVFSIWNPSGLYCQNLDAKLAGARAAVKVFEKYGFSGIALSRWD